MQNILKTIAFICLLLGSFTAQAQRDIFGKWKTIDDETGETKSIVEIYKQNGKAYGKVTKIFTGPGEDPDPICTACDGDEKNEKIIGMEIIKGLEQDGDDWEDGTILDPESGKVYDCEIWRDEDELKVRGYIAFLYRTQTWKKAD